MHVPLNPSPWHNLGPSHAYSICCGVFFCFSSLQGHNSAGQLGQDSTTEYGRDSGTMGDNLPVINLGTGRTVRSIAGACTTNAEDAHVCAILDNGSLKCWGSNSDGQLGQGNTHAMGDDPGELASLNPISLSSEASVTASAVCVGK